MKSIIKTNWLALHKIAKEKGSEEAGNVFYKEYRELENKYIGFRKHYQELRRKHLIAHLKSLEPGATVYYKGRSTGLGIGNPGKKIGDKRKYMIVEFGLIKWRVRYENLTVIPISEPEIKRIKTSVELSKMFSNVKL